MNKIEGFFGPNRFLSNFYPVPNDKTVEHYYQAAKCTNFADYLKIMNAETPAQAKALGKLIDMRPDWDQIKLIVMEQLLIRKFSNYDLAHKLILTEEKELIEANSWGDTFWGVCNGVGHNHLGKLLMKIRDGFFDPTTTIMY